ncbi:MAG: anthranilate synthase component I [Fimbriimonadales bacterium]
MIITTREEFDRVTSSGARAPIYAEILADLETPVSAYWKVASNSEFAFLLESVTGGESLARYSFLGANPVKQIRVTRDNRLIVKSLAYGGETRVQMLSEGESVLEILRSELFDRPYAEVEGLPQFSGGAVGFLSYDLVRKFERIPGKNPDDLDCDDVNLIVCHTLLAFDHAKNRILIIVNSVSGEYDEACEQINSIVSQLRAPLPTFAQISQEPNPEFSANVTKAQFETSVSQAVEFIAAGEGVQFVLSQRFSASTTVAPIGVYRCLRSINPSPYMYLLKLPECDIVGASPEILVSFQDGLARVRPIAGTRKRGDNQEEDERLATELLADQKERAEHIMLVDLGRNDLGRISKSGTVKLNEFMSIEKYSHVMHIVSDVTGEVKSGLDCFDVLQACFPAGTVSGAPKVRAMEIIDELETTRRGLYAGAVGYFGLNGDMDLAIAIRTILLKGGKAHVQAGAGIVYDSVPEKEFEECQNKAAAVIRAVKMAHKGIE